MIKKYDGSLSCDMNDDGQYTTSRSQKAITFIFALSLVYGNIVGCGIFISVKPTLDVFSSNSIGMVVIFWLTAGIISIFGGLCYAELGTRIPRSGGERAYYREVLGSEFSKTFVIIFAFILKPLTIAALSLIVGKYIITTVGLDNPVPWLEKLLGFAFLFSCFLVNCISKVIANKIGVVLTILKTLALLIIIGSGIWYLSNGNTEEWKDPFQVTDLDLGKLGFCLVNLFWTYEGWNTLGLIAGDMINPRRDLPRSIIIGLLAVIILYTMTVISYCSVLGYYQVRTIETVATSFAQKVLAVAYPIIPLLICCSGLGALNGNLYATSCICVSAGQSGDIPKIFSLVHRNQRTGIFSLIVIMGIACAFLPLNFQAILGYSAFISWLFYFISTICLWRLKIQTRNLEHSEIFVVPYPLIIIVQITCLVVIGLCVYNEPFGTLIFSCILLGIFAFQFIPDRWTDIRCLRGIHRATINFLCRNCFLDEATECDVS